MIRKVLPHSLGTTLIMCVALFGFGCDRGNDTNPLDLYSIDMDTDRIEFPAEGSSLSFSLTTNAAWEINTRSDVMSFTPTEGSSPAENQTVIVTMPPRADGQYDELTSEITVKTGDLETDMVVRRSVAIVQKGYERPADRDPGIWTTGDWTAFAAAYNSAGDISEWQDEEGVINLLADIDFGAGTIPSIGDQSTANGFAAAGEIAFAHRFDGNEFTISGKLDGGDKMIVAIFNRLAPAGIIENLRVNVTGESRWASSNGHISGIVGFTISVAGGGGYIKNCVAMGTLTHAAPASNAVRVGGIVAYCRTNVYGCENRMTIVAASNRVGGITGAGGTATVIEDCSNTGDITVSAPANKPQVGGIIGQLNGQTVTGCSNSGTITVDAEDGAYVGGIAGQAQNADAKVGLVDEGKGNTNEGTVFLKYSSAITVGTPAIGGIVGNVNANNVPVTGGVNKGSVTSDVPLSASATIMAGGIIGRLHVSSPVTGCENAEGATVKAATNTGGIVGRATGGAGVLTGCKNAGTVDAVDSIAAPYIGGIIGNKGGATYTDCIYGGTVLGIPGTVDNAEGVPAP